MNTHDINESRAALASEVNPQMQQLEQLRTLLNLPSATNDAIEIDGQQYIAKKFAIRSLPMLHEVALSLAQKSVNLSAGFDAMAAQVILPELCVLIVHSIDLKDKSPLDFAEEDFAKLLLATLKANPSFFVQALAKTRAQAMKKKG
jgi:hypothetical protein